MSDAMCPVKLTALNKDRFGLNVMILSDDLGRHLPIWIHECDAFAIGLHLAGQQMPRPLTHDLLRSSVEKLGAEVTRLLIDDFWQDTYYAKLCVLAGDEEMQVDCRPSDGLALALRAGAPVLVRDEVMEEGKVELPLLDDRESDDTAE